MVHSWAQRLWGWAGIRWKHLCVIAKTGFEDSVRSKLLDQVWPCGCGVKQGSPSLRGSYWPVPDTETSQTLFCMHQPCQQQGSGPVLYSGTVWQGKALPARSEAEEQTASALAQKWSCRLLFDCTNLQDSWKNREWSAWGYDPGWLTCLVARSSRLFEVMFGEIKDISRNPALRVVGKFILLCPDGKVEVHLEYFPKLRQWRVAEIASYPNFLTPSSVVFLLKHKMLMQNLKSLESLKIQLFSSFLPQYVDHLASLSAFLPFVLLHYIQAGYPGSGQE